MFPSFVLNPKNCRYEGQDDDEHILLLLRAHPVTNLSWIFMSIFVFFIPFLFVEAVTIFGIDFSFVPQSFALAMLIVNYLLVLIILFEGFLSWYFNVSIITNKRIVDVDFHSMLHRSIDLAPLSSVEEASSSLGGILKAIFHYGDVHVQTAGARSTIEFLNVPEPQKVSDLILDEMLKAKHH